MAALPTPPGYFLIFFLAILCNAIQCQTQGNFCLRNLGSGKSFLVQSGILDFGSRIQLKETEIHSVEST